MQFAYTHLSNMEGQQHLHAANTKCIIWAFIKEVYNNTPTKAQSFAGFPTYNTPLIAFMEALYLKLTPRVYRGEPVFFLDIQTSIFQYRVWWVEKNVWNSLKVWWVTRSDNSFSGSDRAFLLFIKTVKPGIFKMVILNQAEMMWDELRGVQKGLFCSLWVHVCGSVCISSTSIPPL